MSITRIDFTVGYANPRKFALLATNPFKRNEVALVEVIDPFAPKLIQSYTTKSGKLRTTANMIFTQVYGFAGTAGDNAEIVTMLEMITR